MKLLGVLGLLGVLACHKYQISDIRPTEGFGNISDSWVISVTGLNDVSDFRVIRVSGRIGILVILVLLG